MDISLSDIAWVGGTLVVFAVVRILFTQRAALAQAIDDLLLSRGGSATIAPSSRTGPALLVRGDTDQAEPELVRDFATVLDFLKRHNLTDDQLIAVYAVSHRAPDDYPLSANKIRDAVGGTRDDVLAAVAAHRPKVANPRPAARLERPANGWGKAS